MVEPARLMVSREYEVTWKKQSLDTDELSKLRFEEKLGSRQIAARMGKPRTTVADAIRRLGEARRVR